MQALEEHRMNEGKDLGKNASLLQRVLALDSNNPKLATILAIDMFLVGIDTVSTTLNISSGAPVGKNTFTDGSHIFFFLIDICRHRIYPLPTSEKSRQTTDSIRGN